MNTKHEDEITFLTLSCALRIASREYTFMLSLSGLMSRAMSCARKVNMYCTEHRKPENSTRNQWFILQRSF